VNIYIFVVAIVTR